MIQSNEPTLVQMNYAILKFMGYEKVTVGYSGTEEETEWQRNHEEWMKNVGIKLVGDYIVDELNNKWHHWEDVKYHISWDWLMPVWKRLIDVVAGQTEEGDYPADFSTIMDMYAYHCEQVDITAAHDIVCKGIQWYNQQKQTNEQ